MLMLLVSNIYAGLLSLTRLFSRVVRAPLTRVRGNARGRVMASSSPAKACGAAEGASSSKPRAMPGVVVGDFVPTICCGHEEWFRCSCPSLKGRGLGRAAQ